MEDCVFKEHHNTNGYSSFESKSHAGWFLALTNEGRAKPGPKLRPAREPWNFYQEKFNLLIDFPLNIKLLLHSIMLIAQYFYF